MAEPAMRVKEIRIYPIKSIRGFTVPTHRASPMGFEYDRIFMFRRASDKSNMHVSDFASMCLFTTSLHPSPADPTTLQVRFGLDHTFGKPEQKLTAEESVLEIPLRPEVEDLQKAHLSMHNTNTDMYIMPEKYCQWFSDRFGFEVELNYIGLYKRRILGNINPNAPRTFVGDPDPRGKNTKAGITSGLSGGWLDGLKAGVGNLLGTVTSYAGIDSYKAIEDGIGFADCAAFLVVNWESHLEAQKRVEMNDLTVEKFRPNIVIEGAEGAWVEDYWGEISIGGNPDDDDDNDEGKGTRIGFTSNCLRCASLNVDYATGRPAEGPEGKLLKSLQRDRRVDPGHKYSPVFGRYGFMSVKNGVAPKELVSISVGDEVIVTKTNERRTYWCKFEHLIPVPILPGISICGKRSTERHHELTPYPSSNTTRTPPPLTPSLIDR